MTKGKQVKIKLSGYCGVITDIYNDHGILRYKVQHEIQNGSIDPNYIETYGTYHTENDIEPAGEK